MLWSIAAAVAVLLRSAFDANQASILLSHRDNKAGNAMLARVLDQRLCNYVSSSNIRPSLLVLNDETGTHKFLHYNFTLFCCLWGGELQVSEKIGFFRDMSKWLVTYNQTLKSSFSESDDYLAWNIAFCDDDQHHFD